MRLSTKTALVLAMFALICVGGTGTYLYSLSRSGYEEVVLDRQSLLVAQNAAHLRQELALATEKLDRMAHMSEIDLGDDDDGPERRLLSEAWRLGLFFSRGRIELLDAQGLCHGAEPEHDSCAGRSYADAPWFEEGRAARAPTLRIRPLGERDALLGFFVPIRDRGSLVGILHGELELSRSQLLEQPTDAALTPEVTILVDGEGTLLHVGGEPALDEPAWQWVLQRAAEGQAGAERNETNVDRAFAWAPVGTTGAVLVQQWTWSALDPHGDERMQALVTAAVVLGFLGVLLGFVLATTINAPVLALAHDVHRAKTGARIEKGQGKDEIAELRNAFVDLVGELEEREDLARRDRDRIAELADTLEERVEERTAELEQAQERVVKAERLAALGRAGAALSHEIRNSLNGLSVGMDALGRLTGDAHTKVRKQVRAEIGRLLVLADALLDLARPRDLRCARVDVGSLIERSRFLVEDDAQERQVQLTTRCEAGEVVVDEALVQSILTNLLRNAVLAVAQQSGERRVALRSCFDGRSWIVEVDDNGPGVDPAKADSIFEPFVSGRPGGVGLGLAISSRFAQLHHGSLGLAPGDLGGACFRLEMPIEYVTDPPTPPETA